MAKTKEVIIGLNGHPVPIADVKRIRKAQKAGRYGPPCETIYEGCIGSCDWCTTRIIKGQK